VYMYIFVGSCPLVEFCQVQNSLCVQVLRSPILATLLRGTRAMGVGQSLLRLAAGAPYIRQCGHHVGIGPHSSSVHLLHVVSVVVLLLLHAN